MQTNDAETAEQIGGLLGVVSDLERLERLLADENAAPLQSLPKFAADPDLKRLRDLVEKQRSEFDALDFLRLSNDEEFHSNFLAWLLNPQQNHGLGDYFVRYFLPLTGAIAGVDSSDWSSMSVRREWPNVVDGVSGRLDILVVNHAERFLCAIENKVWSWEHSEQLTRYRRALEEHYPDYTRYHVFLSPAGTLPYREEEQEHWTAVNYKVVLQLVEQSISNSVNPVKEDVRAFLQQYAITLRRNIVSEANTNITELVRRIYLEHREAIELIIQYKPDFVAEARAIFREAIALQRDWIVFDERNNLIRFRPMDWNRFIVPPNESPPLAFEFDWRWRGNYPRLGLVFDPENAANKSARDKLHLACTQNPNLFVGIQRLRASWLWLLFTEPILDDSHYSRWEDEEAVRTTIMDWVAKFAENEFLVMNEVIVNCLREYEEQQRGS